MTEEKQCDCKEKAIAKIKEFSFIAGAVFVGTTLSILLCANILKPKCPMGAIGPMPVGIHRQLPPPPMMHGDYDRGMFRKHRGDCPCRKFKHQKGEFKRGPHNPEYQPPIEPQKVTNKK